MTIPTNHRSPPFRPARLPAVAALAVVAALGAGCESAPVYQAEAVPGAVDHHVHLLSPGLVADWKGLGVPFSRPDSVYISPAALLEGDSASLGRAVLVPMAHLYGMGEFRGALKLSVADEEARVRAENDHVAGQAARYPARAVALCAVGVLRPYADRELARCRDSLGVAGWKFHLAASEMDLTDTTQLARLRDLFGQAAAAGLPVLLHFDPQRRGLEVEHVRRFIDQVVAPHPGLELYLAHLGGSGGYGPWTRSVFGAFREWMLTVPDRPVYVELSAVILERASEGVPATTDEEAALLADDLRALGLHRVVFGSDYPVFDPGRYVSVLVSRTGLTPDEVRGIVSNRGPLLGGRSP